MSNALLITQLILQAAQQLQRLSAVLNTAHAEGRDVTDTELAELGGVDDAARAALDQAIAQARS
jgi:hypothetical protein